MIMKNYLRIIIISAFIILLILIRRRLFSYSINFNHIFAAKTAVDFYHYARLLRIHGITDPPCTRSRNIYVCSGICPWINRNHKKLVSCSFLPRRINSDFIKYNIFCIPDADKCLDYNAWLKDELPMLHAPIKRIPSHLLSNFTLNFSIAVAYGNQEFRAGQNSGIRWNSKIIEDYRRQVRARLPFGTYQNKDIYPVLDKYWSVAVKNKKCVVIGTEKPWIEAALLEYQASSVTTIEYSTIESDVPRLYTNTPQAFSREQQKASSPQKLFDSVWSYSSLEHDGLGRYQDPLNPYGDFQTMVKITCVLKPGGFLFLSVPLASQDFIQFNLHRIYGPIRLPLLYQYFHVVEVFGELLPLEHGSYIQPFVVLQNKLGCRTS